MTTTWARRPVGVVFAVVLAVFASACGVPVDDEPRVIRPESVPFDLLGQSDTDAPVEPAAHLDPRPATVFLVASDEGRLVLRSSVRRIATPVNLDTVLRNLMAGGVTEDERNDKRANLVPSGELRQVTPMGNMAVVDVSDDFFTRLPRNQSGRLAIAQIVYTVTAFGGQTSSPITRVQFTVEGAPTPVPDATGSTQAVVTRDDYIEFLPSPEPAVRSSTTTSTTSTSTTSTSTTTTSTTTPTTTSTTSTTR